MKKLAIKIRNPAFALAIALGGCLAPPFSPSAPNSIASVQRPADSDPFLNLQPAAIPQELQNSWTPELEAEFQQRARAIIQFYRNPKTYGNTAQENEKRSYARAMFDFLAGNRDRAIAFLQQEDSQAREHAHTDGIDYYFSFTLKGQIRKYFLFGPYLDPAYKQRMFDGAKKWTERDPLQRPHPLYGNGDGSGQDWSIQRRGLWVDGRNTDNLRAMRETSVYLMAEETGNEAVRQQYKQKIQRYVWALYNIGMGEWDSENYHGHTFAPYLNLYDFARDPEVKASAKAALDWLSTAAALKYRRGGWGGPTKRDYGGANVVYGSSAARTFDLYFGDVPLPNPEPELDTLHLITSRYRPPLAVVALARKQFQSPVELLATKPIYENWKQGGEDKPAYWETQFFGRNYQMGSVISSFADGDVGPFKIVADNSQRGVDYFVANSGDEGLKPGKNPGDQIGQFRNLLIGLRPADRPFFFQLPKTAKMEIEAGIWFFKFEKVAIALRPIQLNDYGEVAIPETKATRGYGAERWLKATPKGEGLAGFALEVGDLLEENDYPRFQEAVKRRGALNLAGLNAGTVELKGSDGHRLKLTWRDRWPVVDRDGEVNDGLQHRELYRVVSGPSIVSLGWKGGTLAVEAGGQTFTSAVGTERATGPTSGTLPQRSQSHKIVKSQ